jgi:hypothetical protein
VIPRGASGFIKIDESHRSEHDDRVLLPKPVAEGVRDGSVTLAFRRWEEPRVRVGGTQLTMAGVVAFDAVDEIEDLATLSDEAARAAGCRDAEDLRRRLAPIDAKRGPRGSKGGDHVYRIRLRYVGADPRVSLRDAVPDPDDLTGLRAAVGRLDDGRRSGPWTRQILEWIADNPGVVSTELAQLLGREVAPMKADIRKLKALGLTISQPVGYELSARGRAYLDSLPDPDANDEEADAVDA